MRGQDVAWKPDFLNINRGMNVERERECVCVREGKRD